MSKGLFIVGTDTDVGKTFVTAGMMRVLLKNEINAISYKPVQSGGVLKDEKLLSTDVEFVKTVADIKENVPMNSYCLKEPVSPHLAAEVDHLQIDIKKILNDYKTLQEKYNYVIVEGAGGVVVPLIRDEYYIYNLIKELNIPVAIVARAGVGTINHTSLTLHFLQSIGIEVKGIIINQYNGSYYEKDNIEVIKKIAGIKNVVTIDKVALIEDEMNIEKVRDYFETNLSLEKVLNFFN